MTRLQMVKYEAAQIPIPDPKQLSKEEKQRILDALQDLMDREEELVEEGVVEPEEQLEKKEDELDALDRAVLSTIGMEDRLDELKKSVEALVDLRREGAGEQTEVLVNRTEEEQVIELEGVSEARESTRLTDFSS
ncbi:hypothetical protein [Halobacterium salinarum]|uniref:Uncharacterized protein n=1 Tax=Halobacterium salinarum (strain ATCC 33171 / DSM 3754 / JCM 8978 / NBRC 102687 / NCIMB 764 / 91-R6) TaxID=2597657 RepID=A0A663A632_HALS9|nr:hypothetical protein [Halobacterium salinarum]TYO74937.1 hypothetical protein APQ99_02179 [Halobacterium salinarum DSM 3754]